MAMVDLNLFAQFSIPSKNSIAMLHICIEQHCNVGMKMRMTMRTNKIQHPSNNYPARTLRALGLLLADGAPTVGRGKTFWRVGRVPLTKTGVTPKRKVAQ